MNAPIDQRHRELAFAAVWTCPPSRNELEWIATGEGVGGGPLLRGVAQALAGLEARTARRAWCEGARAGLDAENPYPDVEL